MGVPQTPLHRCGDAAHAVGPMPVHLQHRAHTASHAKNSPSDGVRVSLLAPVVAPVLGACSWASRRGGRVRRGAWSRSTASVLATGGAVCGRRGRPPPSPGRVRRNMSGGHTHSGQMHSRLNPACLPAAAPDAAGEPCRPGKEEEAGSPPHYSFYEDTQNGRTAFLRLKRPNRGQCVTKLQRTDSSVHSKFSI